MTDHSILSAHSENCISLYNGTLKNHNELILKEEEERTYTSSFAFSWSFAWLRN